MNQSVEPNSRIFIREARFANPRAELKPGMFAAARFRQPGDVRAIFVPHDTVTCDKRTDSNQAFVIQNGKARLRVVRIGDAVNKNVRIVSGMNTGAVVALNNQNQLFYGAYGPKDRPPSTSKAARQPS